MLAPGSEPDAIAVNDNAAPRWRFGGFDRETDGIVLKIAARLGVAGAVTLLLFLSLVGSGFVPLHADGLTWLIWPALFGVISGLLWLGSLIHRDFGDHSNVTKR